MPRRKRTPEEIARKAKVRELMQELDINDISDINALFKEFVGDILETVWKQSWTKNSTTVSTITAIKTQITAATAIAQKH